MNIADPGGALSILWKSNPSKNIARVSACEAKCINLGILSFYWELEFFGL